MKTLMLKARLWPRYRYLSGGFVDLTSEYRVAGFPYGLNRSGFLRWSREERIITDIPPQPTRATTEGVASE